MAQSDKLSELGIDPALLSAGQRDVLNNLSAEEINTFITVMQRMNTVDGDVQGHSDVGGLIF